MRERTAQHRSLALTLFLCWSTTALHAAEPAPSVHQRGLPTRSQRHPTSSRCLSSLPSSVSSDIQSFVSQRVGHLQPPAAATRRSMPGPGKAVAMCPRSCRHRSPACPGEACRLVTAPSPLATALSLKAAPFEPTDLRFPINLGTALRLSDARPLIVAAAQARAWVAEAELTKAKFLWVPTINMAFDYLRHDGGGPDFNKGVMTSPSVNFFYGGLGMGGFLSLADAVYEPLVARQVLIARQWSIQSAKNDALLQTADAYFAVHQYRGMYAGSLYVVERARDVVGRITALSRDLISAFEVDRARNMLADLEQQAVSARQHWRVQSAKLTRVLRLDPRAVVEPMEHDHLQITLIDPALTLDELMPIALANRPEIASRRALIEAAEVGVRREKARPFIPILVLTGFQSPGGMLIQGGFFGLGPNSSLNQWTGRDDVSIQLIWQLEHLGIRQPRTNQSSARPGVAGHHRPSQGPGRGGGGSEPGPCKSPVGGGAGRPGRPRPAHGHHHLEWNHRGPGANQPVRRRAGADQPAAGGGLRAPALDEGF